MAVYTRCPFGLGDELALYLAFSPNGGFLIKITSSTPTFGRSNTVALIDRLSYCMPSVLACASITCEGMINRDGIEHIGPVRIDETISHVPLFCRLRHGLFKRPGMLRPSPPAPETSNRSTPSGCTNQRVVHFRIHSTVRRYQRYCVVKTSCVRPPFRKSRIARVETQRDATRQRRDMATGVPVLEFLRGWI